MKTQTNASTALVLRMLMAKVVAKQAALFLSTRVSAYIQVR